MAQKVTGYIKLQIPAGKATPAPPVGPALGQHGVNIMAFTKEFNERTQKDMGYIIPVVITVYADRSFSFITKTPPAPVLIKKACGIESGSGVPNKTKVATITKAQLEEIAKTKMPDLNAANLESAISMDRQDQDARPERRQPGERDQHDRRHLPQHGRHRHRVIGPRLNSWEEIDPIDHTGG